MYSSFKVALLKIKCVVVDIFLSDFTLCYHDIPLEMTMTRKDNCNT